ncbi:methionyl-tRNA formyltransferase [Acidobacteriota bacterium]
MKTILFCAEKTRYGFAFLRQFLQSDFTIIGVVLPTHRKWHAYLEKYSGEKIGSFDLYKRKIKAVIKKTISQSLISRIPKVYQRTLNAEVILKKHNVPYWHVDDVNSEELITRLKKTEPDIILCAGYPQIFSEALLNLPKYGAINIHPSPLPKFRGPTPFYWIIAKGETESAVTAHFMTENIDAGDIIAQIKFPILDMTCDELISKSIEETPLLIKQIHKFLSEGRQAPKKQDDLLASYFRFDKENDNRLFWNQQDVHQIYNLTRTGKAFCFFRNQKIGLTECSISEINPNLTNDIKIEEGAVVNTSNDSVMIKAKDGNVDLREVVYKGRTMTAKQLMKRLKIQIGEKFT